MGLNVLSLFDGMSCTQIALNRMGIDIENYYASEIDPYAMQVTQANYPNTMQLGDITKIRYENGELVSSEGTTKTNIDIVVAGSPCVGFSFAGKQLAFDDPRSKLFFEFVRILNEVKPKYFLLENVRMKAQFEDVINKAVGVKPILINSSLVSAQNRPRKYWTNIPVDVLEDKGIVIRDIIEKEVEDKYYLSERMIKGFHAKYQRYLDSGSKSGFGRKLEPNELDGKCFCLTARYFKMGIADPYIYDVKGIRKFTPLECERLQTVDDFYTDKGISNTQRYKMLGNGFTIDVITHLLKNMEF